MLFFSNNDRIRHPIKSVIFFVIVLYIGLLQTVHGNPRQKVLIFSNISEWAPYATSSEFSASPGILLEVLFQFLDLNNTTFEIQPYPNQRQFLKLKRGKIDSFPRAKEWTDNPDQYYWTDIIINSVDHLILRKESTFQFSKTEDLFGKNLMTIHGYGYPTLDQYFESKQIRKLSVYSYNKLYDRILNSNIDGGITDKLVALWKFKNSENLDINRYRFSKRPVHSAGIRFIFRQENK